MNGNYYIYTSTLFDSLDKTKIYSRFYDNNKENVVLLATEALTGYDQSFTSDTATIIYIQNNQGVWPPMEELHFEDEYIPKIDD